LLLEDLGLKVLVVNYLTEPLSKSKLQEILVKIKLKPSQLIRKNEADWKALNNRKELNENQILDILIKYPKTIERPIVTSEDSGVLARPLENLITFLGIN
jgi:arsenate reductase